MFFKKTVCILISTSLLIPITTFANALTLTPTQIQKLKTYFPDDAVNTNLIENHFVWKGDPIVLDLPLNQEKRVRFPAHVTVDIKGALSSDQLQITNNDQSLYLKALTTFDRTRVYITLEGSQEVVLLDLETSDKANAETATVDIQQNNHALPLQVAKEGSATLMTLATKNNFGALATSSTSNVDSNSEDSTNGAVTLSEGDIYVALTRYAWQQLYAPTRLLSNPLGITRTPMQVNTMDTNLIYGDKIYAHPLAAWSLNNHTITAVQLRNKYPHATHIRIPQDICGNWSAVVAYPTMQLAPAGHKLKDSTTLFLLSHEPYMKTMEICHVSASHE